MKPECRINGEMRMTKEEKDWIPATRLRGHKLRGNDKGGGRSEWVDTWIQRETVDLRKSTLQLLKLGSEGN